MPITIKKSILRDRRSPLNSSSNRTKTSQTSSTITFKKLRPNHFRKRKSYLIAKSKLVLKRKVSSTSASKAKSNLKRNAISKRTQSVVKLKEQFIFAVAQVHILKSKTLAIISSDSKLQSSPTVEISAECQEKADSFAMKLRKGSKIVESSSRSSRSLKDESDDQTTEEDTTTSEIEDSDEEEDDFDKSKTYTLRKKASRVNNNVRRKVTVVSSSSSDSESLPDLDFPIDRRYKDKVTETSTSSTKSTPTVVVGNGSVDNRRHQTQQQAMGGSSQSKPIQTRRQSCDDHKSLPNSVIKARSLRSSDGHLPQQQPSHSRYTPENVRKSISPSHKMIKPQLQSSVPNNNNVSRSPERNRVEKQTPKKVAAVATPSQDSEKSYSLRGLDKKPNFSPDIITETYSTTTATTPKVQNENKTVTHSTEPAESKQNPPSAELSGTEVVPVRRGRGRPRKIPKEISKDGEASASKDSSTTPVTRSQRRVVAPTVNTPLSPDRKLKSPATIVKPNTTNSIVQKGGVATRTPHVVVPSKQLRNAIALRAKQSKIMAKSRVWQSNSRANGGGGWRGGMKQEQVSNFPINYQSMADKQFKPSASTSSGNNFRENQLSHHGYFGNESSSLIKSTKNHPVAKCVLCNMTFTRRFSLTKHYMTIQHKKMVQKAGKLGSGERQGGFVNRLPILSSNKSGPGRRPSTIVNKSIGSHQHHNVPLLSKRTSGSSNEDDDDDDDDDEDSSAFNNHHIPRFGIGESLPPIYENEHKGFESDSETQQPKGPTEWISGKAHGKNNFICDVCGEKFTKKREFSSHLWDHRENADLICPECGYQFTESEDYNQHIDNAHLVNTRYSCKYCTSSFNRESYLEKHMMSHRRDMNEKFICSLCDKRFSAHDLLLRHFDIKHLALGKPKVELACDSSDELRMKQDSRVPEFIECDNYFENYDPNSYHDEDVDQDDYRDEMPDIDLELDDDDDDLTTTRNGNMRYGSSDNNNDPVPFISPEDYSREIPVKICNPYRVDLSRISSRGGSSFARFKQQHKQTFRKPGGQTLAIEQDRMMGCGFKSRRANVPISYSEGQFPCRDCGKIFETKKLLAKHVEYFNLAERHTCPVCKKKFKWRYLLNRHLVRHTKQNGQMKKSTNQQIQQPVGGGGMRKQPSFLKHRKLSTAREIPKLLPILTKNPSMHVSSVVPSRSVAASIPSHSSSKPNYTSILPSIEPSDLEDSSDTTNKMPVPTPSSQLNKGFKSFTCDLCSESFTEKQTLVLHKWYHQKGNVLSCPECEAKCERKSDLDLHYKCHETGQPFFLCYVCFKPFRWKKDMVRHIRRVHIEERTYRCLYCPNRFRTNEELNGHISDNHAEHRSFPCEYCGRRYAQRRYLLIHIETRHGVEPVRHGVQPGYQAFNNDQEEEDTDFDISHYLETGHQM